jgi:hypothetical protein
VGRATVVFLVLSVAMVALLAWDRKPPWQAVELPAGLTYQVNLRTYKDGAYADQPFELEIVSDAGSSRRRLLTASQCKNVRIAPTPRAIYIFYDHIVLSHFAAPGADLSRPRPILCDMRDEGCSNRLRALASQKVPFTPVCTFS